MHGIKGMGIAMLLMLTTSLAFSAQDSSVLLEKAIYTEETLGKLNDAITIYKQIIDAADTNRTIGALAIYRLGICYRKSGSEAEALATFSALARLYPEQKDLIAKGLLLNLQPAPWVDGEIMRLTQKRIGTEGVGGVESYATYSVESSQVDGKPAWNFRYLFGLSRSPIYYSVTEADAGTMLPITSRTLSNQTDLEARYAADKVEVLNLKDSAQSPKQIPLAGSVYDAWQIVPLLRRLPLREGFQVTVPMFGASTGSFANVQFSVVARETITVPAGSFECYKIVMTSDDNAPTEQTFWISADNHAYLAKAHIDRINDFELKSVEIVGKDQLVNVEDPELGIGLSAPRQWYLSLLSRMSAISGSSSVVDVGRILMLVAPELDSSLNVTVSGNKPEYGSVVKLVDMRMSATNNTAQRYQVRPETRESVSIAGLTGERYIADTSDFTSGESIVEYAYYLASQTKRYTFAFQTEKDNFDRMRPAFESIISSLRIQ